MGTVLKIVLAGIILMVLAIGGCAVVFSSAVDEVEKESKKNAITAQEFKSIKQGATLKQVKKRFGEPSNEQVTEVEGMKMNCIYYPVDNDQMLDEYQFCFDNGRLSSKADY